MNEEEQWIETNNATCAIIRQLHDSIALASLPPRRRWIDLTDEEMREIIRAHDVYLDMCRAIEAKLKEKNT